VIRILVCFSDQIQVLLEVQETSQPDGCLPQSQYEV
jgi:hypothetical protein